MSNVKKSIAERTCHKRLYDRRVNKRQMQKQESKVDLGKALDAGLVVKESSETEFGKQNTSSRSGNDTNIDDADIRLYDKEPMVEVQLTAECNIFATGQHHTKQPKIINEDLSKPFTQHYLPKGRESAFAKPHHVIASSESRNSSKKMSRSKPRFNSNDMVHYHSLEEAKKKTQERIRNSKPSVMPSRPQSTTNVVRKLTTFKSERPKISKQWFASQVDVKNDLSKPSTQHYLPKGRESAFAKPHHVIASSESRNSSKKMSRSKPRFNSNDMVHYHSLEEAKKKTQERIRNSKPSVMPSRPQSTTNGSKPKPRSDNQTSRIFLVSKSSCVMSNVIPLVDHYRNSSPF
ncbi:hypothetical protein Tco_1347138 [Tanacetum coccineum]